MEKEAPLPKGGWPRSGQGAAFFAPFAVKKGLLTKPELLCITANNLYISHILNYLL
jgi:hypothetical protein